MKIFPNKNLKSLIIILGFTILFVATLITISAYSSKKNLQSIKSLTDLAVSNNWATEKDFSNCTKDQKGCAKRANEFITNGIQVAVPYINFDQQKLDNASSQINFDIDNNHYDIAYQKAESLISIYKQQYTSVWSKNKNDFTNIKEEINLKSPLPKNNTFIANYLINQSFAKATLFISNISGVDSAFYYLNKQDGKWIVVLGPGSSYTDLELRAVGVSDEIIKNLDYGINIPVFYDPKSAPPKTLLSLSGYIENNQTKTSSDLLIKLPYFSPKNDYSIDYQVNKNNLNDITYIVNIYYQEKSQIKTTKDLALLWLSSNGAKINNSIQYKEFPMDASGGL